MDKILSFVVNEDNKLLLLKGNSNDPQFKKSFWYVVTGGCEKEDKTKEDAIKREIKEETKIIDIKDVMYLNWIFKYYSLGIECTEYAYMTFVGEDKVVLNEESVNYKWCNIEEFIKEIHWFGSKEHLYEVLKNGLNKKIYFEYEKVENF